MADEDHEELNDLFDDDDDDAQPANEQQLEDADAEAGYDPEQEDLEDDMGVDAQPAGAGAAAAGDEDGLAEADLFGSDDEEAAEPAADEPLGAPITVSAPLLQRPPNGQLVLLKVPNIIKLDPQPYDPEQFDGGFEEVVEKGKKRLRPNDINVIRWRYRQNDDGTVTKESNARYVQWSDGTESIMLGDEVLTMERKQQPRANSYVHVVRYDAIQGLAHMKQMVHLKPASLDNKLHQRLKMTVQKATQKADKVQMHFAARNPEVEKAEAEKRAEEQARLRRIQARASERNRAPKQRPPAFTAAYIEQDDEDEPDYYAGGRAAAAADDEDDYYRRRVDDEEAAARLQSAKRSTPPPASTRSAKQARVKESEEEEELEEAGKAAAGLKVRRGAILDDDDD